jgi:hypothetical protein
MGGSKFIFTLVFLILFLAGLFIVSELAIMGKISLPQSLGGLELPLQTSLEVQKQTAIKKAKQVYLEKASQGVDMTSGPCLTNQLISDWVLDIAHDPRRAIDNLPENQCEAYIEGRAHHFVELDIDGNLIWAE